MIYSFIRTFICFKKKKKKKLSCWWSDRVDNIVEKWTHNLSDDFISLDTDKQCTIACVKLSC